MRYFRCLYLILVVASLFVSCRVGPAYKPAYVDTPDEWKNDQEEAPAPQFTGLWWELFNDDVLNQLEAHAVIYNPRLLEALDRVAQARAIAGIDKSALYPQINLSPSFQDEGTLFKLYLPPGAGNLLGPTVPTIYRIHELLYNMPLTMSYELDLWGKLRGQYASAILNARAQEESFQSALLTLTSDLAVAYFKMRALDAQVVVYEDNIEMLKKSLALTKSRFSKGLVSEQDVFAASQSVSDNEAVLYDTIRQRELQVNQIATLSGINASEFCLEPMPLVDLPPSVPVGLPSSILLNRPDIAAAERSMAAQHALIGVAYAEFLPSIELTGMLGFFSPDIKQFLHWKSRLWSIGMSAVQPIFNGGYNQANLNLAYAEYKEALHAYQQAALNAFQEVEDSLVNLKMQTKEYQSYLNSSEAAVKRDKLSNRRYQNGITNYLEVLDSERNRIAAQGNQVIALGQTYIATVQLIKAIGGSWDVRECENAGLTTECTEITEGE